MDDAKLREILAALLEEMRNSKVQISDVLAQRSEYAADIRDLKASIDTTRRALDPEALGEHVANNIDDMMGQTVQKFAKGIQLNFDAGHANQNAARETNQAAKDLAAKLNKINMERNALAAIARHLEERDQRSKWDWVTLGCAMVVAGDWQAQGPSTSQNRNWIPQTSQTQSASSRTMTATIGAEPQHKLPSSQTERADHTVQSL